MEVGGLAVERHWVQISVGILQDLMNDPGAPEIPT